MLTIALLSDSHEFSFVSQIAASVAALLIGKAFLLADKLPFFHRYAGHPLIDNVLWKTALYFVVTLTLHLPERLVSAATDSRGFLYAAKADAAVSGLPPSPSCISGPHCRCFSTPP